MNNLFQLTANFRSVMLLIVCAVVLSLFAAPEESRAKGGGGDDVRSEFYGIIEARPENGMLGEWVIGGHSFIADAGTEFDQSEGVLSVGGCAKVHVRNGRVHEIDSEPMGDCR